MSRKTPKTPKIGPWRHAIFFALAAGLAAGAILSARTQGDPQEEVIAYSEFLSLAKNGRIAATTENPLQMLVADGRSTQIISGYYIPTAATQGSTGAPQQSVSSPPPRKFSAVAFLPFGSKELGEVLTQAGVPYSVRRVSDALGQMVVGLLPILLFLVLMIWLMGAQMRSMGRGPFGFGRSRHKPVSPDKTRVTLSQVAGMDEAKEEVSELVEFLRDPKRFQKLGGKMPKGVLMSGPPGTGKTLLARAIAGEAGVPFFSISGSDFVEMFVGVGASRVRDLFEQGQKNAPCIIFIDEIDAVGRHRGHGMGGGHDEREQTLNALLVEMDGFETQDGVIIIAATNRPDVLDPALLRPGRFDRQVVVSLPDVSGRAAILRVHARQVKMDRDVDLETIARGTPGYSGAELANVVNESALLAASKGLPSVTMRELEESRDKVRWGKERRSMVITEKEKRVTAYHEAGHAIMIELLEHTDPLHKVTIIPRGPSLGSTMWLPEEDRHSLRRNEALDQVAVIMGGRAAEDIVFGEGTSGARGDIKQATALARKMVCQWGMSEKMGMVDLSSEGDPLFVARDFGKMREYSESTAKIIDEEVKSIVDAAYARAKSLLEKNRSSLEKIAEALLERETLDGLQIKEMMGRINSA